MGHHSGIWVGHFDGNNAVIFRAQNSTFAINLSGERQKCKEIGLFFLREPNKDRVETLQR